MPGPKKAQAQRVKGNLKPSSSSQAAQLLAATGQSPVGFIGFSTQPAFVPASETFDDVDNSLDADFRLVLRKLSKKDTVTKIKALQELIALCDSKSNDDIKAILPFWPRIYNKVALDVDHKVRELSQKALGGLASRAGKHMGPHLKGLMGVWLVSMCDTYPTVATAAYSAFTSTFTEAKRVDALKFCKVEISECLLRNILKHTAQTLSDPTTTSEEDMTAKYNRVVSSSLQAFQKLCIMLPSDSVAPAMSGYFTSLLSDAAFWKHTKSTVATVKSGLLTLMSCVCQFCPSVSADFVKKISPFVFSCIDTSEPIVVSPAWEAILSLVNAHQDCWEHVNWQKAVWPKLKKLLEAGCFGMATTIAPCFLPLLSKLPQRNFPAFFDAMRLGLTKDCLVNSLSEMSAFVQAFVECGQYSVKVTLEADAAITCNLLQDQILVTVEASLTEEKATLAKSPLYALLPPVMASILTTHQDIEELFWKDLSTFITTQLMACQHNLAANTEKEKNEHRQSILMQRIVWLVHGIVFQDVGLPGKRVPVRFSQPVPVESNIAPKQKGALSPALETLIADLLVMSFGMSNEYAAPQLLSLFKDISVIHIPMCAGMRLIRDDDPIKNMLSENFQQQTKSEADPAVESRLSGLLIDDPTETDGDTQPYREFLYGHLLKLLLHHQKENDSNLNHTEQLLMCMFSLMTYLPEKDGSLFLSHTLQALSSHVITCQFIEQLLQQASVVPACRKAVTSLGISARIAQLADEVTGLLGSMHTMDESEKKTEPVWKMLTSVVLYLNMGKGEPFPSSCMDSIVNCCVSSLKRLVAVPQSWAGGKPALMSLVQALLAQPMIVHHPLFSDLLLSLSSLVLRSNIRGGSLEDLESAWLLCLQLILAEPSCAGHMSKVCHFIREWLCSHMDTISDLERVEKVVSLMSTVQEDGDEPSSGGDDEERESSMELETSEQGSGDMECGSKDTAIIMNIVVRDPLWFDEMEEVLQYLYVKGSFLHPDSCSRPAGALHLPSMRSFVLVTVHNLRTIRVGRKRRVANQERGAAGPMSRTELECLSAIAQNILVIKTTQKTHPRVYDDLEPIVEELRRGVSHLLSSLTHRQLITVVNISLDSCLSQLACVGLEGLLKDLLTSKVELHSRKATSVGRRMLRTAFFHRFMAPISGVEKVITFLQDKAELSGNALLEAFALSCTALTSPDLDTDSLAHISGCMAGFASLLADMEEVSHKLKSVVFNQVFEMVKNLKDKGIHLLTGSDLDMAENVDRIHYNVCVARLVNAVVLHQSQDYWEFALCSLVEWLQFLTEVSLSEASHKSLKALAMAVFQLTHSAARTFSQAAVVDQIGSNTPPFAVTSKMKTEWDEFFAEGIFSTLLSLFVSLATESVSRVHTGVWPLVLGSLASAASLCPPTIVPEHQLPARLSLTDDSALPDSLKTLLNHVCPLLNAKERSVGTAAFRILNCVMDAVAECENRALGTYKDDTQEEEEARSPPEALMLVVESNAIYLDALMTVDIEAEVEVAPNTEEHAHAQGYLLAWRLLLELFQSSANELRAQYAQFFKRQELVSHLLDHLFRLMPSSPTPALLDFDTPRKTTDDNGCRDLHQLALNVYRQCLEVTPALVRTWWVDQNRKTANFVDRFTTDNMTQSLCQQQLTSLQASNSSIEDMTIHVRPAAREVCAVYQMAEVSINMTISLPANYPLGKVDIVCDKRVGVSQAQWDRWLLQLNIFLQHQNGSIMEGLRLWKGNIEKKFEGIDDCMVCFSVIHGTTFQLPRLTCRTCRKKFHSSCLYKWFHTSQKSSCPLCRNLF